MVVDDTELVVGCVPLGTVTNYLCLRLLVALRCALTVRLVLWRDACER